MPGAGERRFFGGGLCPPHPVFICKDWLLLLVQGAQLRDASAPGPGTWSGVGRAQGVQADGQRCPRCAAPWSGASWGPRTLGPWGVEGAGAAPWGPLASLCGTLITLSGSPGLWTAAAALRIGAPGLEANGAQPAWGIIQGEPAEPISARSDRLCPDPVNFAPACSGCGCGCGCGGTCGGEGRGRHRQVSSGMRLPRQRGWGGGPSPMRCSQSG